MSLLLKNLTLYFCLLFFFLQYVKDRRLNLRLMDLQLTAGFHNPVSTYNLIAYLNIAIIYQINGK